MNPEVIVEKTGQTTTYACTYRGKGYTVISMWDENTASEAYEVIALDGSDVPPKIQELLIKECNQVRG